jgi:3-oxoacyl-[acyl-carrier-protein] synthase III
VNLDERNDSIFLLGAAAAVPDGSLSVETVVQAERKRYVAQLEALSPRLRERVTAGLGIRAVRVHDGPPSTLGLRAAGAALSRAQIDPSRVRLVVDFSTLPGDEPGLWSLAVRLQGELGCTEAAVLSAQGSGCAGLHLALRAAGALMRAEPELDVALLVASDCVRSAGRVCLPVSILGDAASALVLSRAPAPSRQTPRIASIATSTLGTYHDVIALRGDPPTIQIDGHAFESQILPLHFVMCARLLGRALAGAHCEPERVSQLVYPNTTCADRKSVRRALNLPHAQLSGPGLEQLGHAFASDMVINLPPQWSPEQLGPEACTALIAVGNGFTWGACIIAH